MIWKTLQQLDRIPIRTDKQVEMRNEEHGLTNE